MVLFMAISLIVASKDLDSEYRSFTIEHVLESSIHGLSPGVSTNVLRSAVRKLFIDVTVFVDFPCYSAFIWGDFRA